MAVAAAEARMALGVTLVMLATSWVTMTAMNATRMMETGGSQRGYSRSPEDPEDPKETQRYPKRPKETRRNPKKPKETQRNPKKPEDSQRLGSSWGHPEVIISVS
jgi:hypothetical protein